MKKLIVSCLSMALLAGSSALGADNAGTATTRTAASAAGGTHTVGLIDMAYVFKEYNKFKVLSEDLRAEVEKSDGDAKQMVEELKNLQTQLQSGTLAEGSPEHAALEQKLVQKASELEAFKKLKQRDFLRQEAEIYKTVYLDVQGAVNKLATYYQYSVIMRFNRDKIEDAENPQEIIQGMNRPVVYYNAQDDISQQILDFLNSTYAKSGGRAPAAAAPGAAGAAGTPTATAPGTGASRPR